MSTTFVVGPLILIWDEVVWIATDAEFYLDGADVWTENPPG